MIFFFFQKKNLINPLILGEVIKRIEDVTAELNEKRLKSACKNYREKLVEKLARETVIKDLNVFYGVVDKSVMTYHKG